MILPEAEAEKRPVNLPVCTRRTRRGKMLWKAYWRILLAALLSLSACGREERQRGAISLR